jgi:hypothetical protein
MRHPSSCLIAFSVLLCNPCMMYALAEESEPAGMPWKAPEPLVAHVLPKVSADRLLASVQRLESFGTRHTLSDATSKERGIGAAREWLAAELAGYSSDLRVELEGFDAPKSVRLPEGARVVNVVATLAGTMPEATGRVFYVVGHYDSRNEDAMDRAGEAPGANDDASGVAGVLECARVLAAHRPESTIVFLATAGEEQGLIGAKYHAEQLASKAPAGGWRQVAVLSNDIVGDPSPAFILEKTGAAMAAERVNGLVRVFSEGVPRGASAEVMAKIRGEGAESDSASRQLARFVSFVAARENTSLQPMLVFRQDRFLRGGDHSAFNESGYAAVRFTTPGEDYSRQHVGVTQRDGKAYGDLAAFVDKEYLASVTRLNLATLLHLANAPTPPGNARMLTKNLETGTTLRWEKSPEPDVAGYEVVWRLTTDATWTQSQDAGMATTLALPMSKDNFFFGVRSYDKDGYRSPVSFAWASRE